MTMAKTCKYKKMRRYVSYDSGNTWAATSTYVKGDLIERNSPSCSGGTDVIEWRQMPISAEYICNGGDKHYKERKYVNGVATQETRMGQVYEYLSSDCGASDVPSGVKWIATLSDGTTTSASCNSNTIAKNEVPTNAVTLRIGTCVTKINNHALEKYYSLNAVSLPSTLKDIGNWAFSKSAVQSIVIPNGLTHLGVNAFEHCASLRSISVPSGITQIGSDGFTCAGSFESCTAVTALNIAEGTTDIACQEFFQCYSLPTLNLPSTLRTIGDGAFYSARSLTSVTIPNSVTTIGNNAFRQAKNLRWIDIGSGVTSIGEEAFNLVSGGDSMQYIRVRATTPPALGTYAFSYTNECPILVPCESYEDYRTAWSAYRDRIACSGDTPTPTVYTKWEQDPISEGYVCDGTTKCYRERKYTSTDNVNWTRTNETRKGDVYETDSVDCGYTPTPTVYTKWEQDPISEGYLCDGTTKCYRERKYTSTDNVNWTRTDETRKGEPYETDSVDCGGSEWDEEVPSDVQWIGILRNGDRTSGYTEPMYYANLSDVPGNVVALKFNDKVTSIKNVGTFGSATLPLIHQYLERVYMPSGLTLIASSAFTKSHSLTRVDFPSTVSTIQSNAFGSCSALTSVTFSGSGPRTISKGAFSGCTSLSSISLPSGVSIIDEAAFSGCTSLASLDLSKVNTISGDAFAYCTSLTSVDIPSSVSNMTLGAFKGCTNASMTVHRDTPPSIPKNVNYTMGVPNPIYVPSASVDAYKSAVGWKVYADRIQPIT